MYVLTENVITKIMANTVSLLYNNDYACCNIFTALYLDIRISQLVVVNFV